MRKRAGSVEILAPSTPGIGDPAVLAREGRLSRRGDHESQYQRPEQSALHAHYNTAKLRYGALLPGCRQLPAKTAITTASSTTRPSAVRRLVASASQPIAIGPATEPT
jgi:hypothetical protein